ncbi:MAG: hypothetical protein ACKO38_17445 [Planctomycetota bacterium]
MPRCARRLLIDDSKVGTYHCTSQCVRRSSFQDRAKGGLDVDHRREWFVKRVEDLASIFAVQVSDFSIIDNQFHVILRNRPDLAATWKGREVTQRWQRLSRASLELKPLIGEKLLKELSARRKWVNERKRRLSSISWFMLMLKEPIARAANGAESASNGEANVVAEREIAVDSGQRGTAARFQSASPLFHRLPLNVFCEWLETNACQGSVAAVSVPVAATGEADVRPAPPCADHGAGEASRVANASVAEGQGTLPTPTLAVPDQLPATWERFGFSSKRWSQAVPLVSRRFRWLACVAAAMRLDIRHWTGGS